METAFGGTAYIECAGQNQGVISNTNVIATASNTLYTLNIYAMARNGAFKVQQRIQLVEF